jgi:hypothetical protein
MIRAVLPTRIVALLAGKRIYQGDRKKKKARNGSSFLIYVIRVELHRAVGSLGFLHRRDGNYALLS